MSAAANIPCSDIWEMDHETLYDNITAKDDKLFSGFIKCLNDILKAKKSFDIPKLKELVEFLQARAVERLEGVSNRASVAHMVNTLYHFKMRKVKDEFFSRIKAILYFSRVIRYIPLRAGRILPTGNRGVYHENIFQGPIAEGRRANILIPLTHEVSADSEAVSFKNAAIAKRLANQKNKPRFSRKNLNRMAATYRGPGALWGRSARATKPADPSLTEQMYVRIGARYVQLQKEPKKLKAADVLSEGLAKNLGVPAKAPVPVLVLSEAPSCRVGSVPAEDMFGPSPAASAPSRVPNVNWNSGNPLNAIQDIELWVPESPARVRQVREEADRRLRAFVAPLAPRLKRGTRSKRGRKVVRNNTRGRAARGPSVRSVLAVVGMAVVGALSAAMHVIIPRAADPVAEVSVCGNMFGGPKGRSEQAPSDPSKGVILRPMAGPLVPVGRVQHHPMGLYNTRGLYRNVAEAAPEGYEPNLGPINVEELNLNAIAAAEARAAAKKAKEEADRVALVPAGNLRNLAPGARIPINAIKASRKAANNANREAARIRAEEIAAAEAAAETMNLNAAAAGEAAAAALDSQLSKIKVPMKEGAAAGVFVAERFVPNAGINIRGSVFPVGDTISYFDWVEVPGALRGARRAPYRIDTDGDTTLGEMADRIHAAEIQASKLSGGIGAGVRIRIRGPPQGIYINGQLVRITDATRGELLSSYL